MRVERTSACDVHGEPAWAEVPWGAAPTLAGPRPQEGPSGCAATSGRRLVATAAPAVWLRMGSATHSLTGREPTRWTAHGHRATDRAATSVRTPARSLLARGASRSRMSGGVLRGEPGTPPDAMTPSSRNRHRERKTSPHGAGMGLGITALFVLAIVGVAVLAAALA